MKSLIYEKDVFIKVCKMLKAHLNLDYDLLYDLYSDISETIIKMMSQTSENYRFTPINPVTVILYLLNEYLYIARGNPDKIDELNKDENFLTYVASTCADKYLTNEKLSYSSVSYLNKFNPAISTLALYLNFTLRKLDEIKTINQYDVLVGNMLKKAFSMSKCIQELLVDGFETEAFSTWRTLHENECILLCLIKYGEPIFKAYFRHTTYALAYRKQIPSVEETDRIFAEIKENMRNFDLKSKDMKKYIEYGYLFAIPDIKLNDDFKLNFRDGVEKLAGLGRYSKTYEMSSEISHSSPLLLYSNKQYYFLVSLINLYESFFRLESIFEQLYTHLCSEEDKKKYLALKTTYLSQLHLIYRNLLNDVTKLQKVEVNGESA